MGGRGSSSGISAGQSQGFQYKSNGKIITVQRTSSGIVLVNGTPRAVNYQKMLSGAKDKEGFKKLSSSDLEEKRKKKKKTREYVDGGQARRNRLQRKNRPVGSR